MLSFNNVIKYILVTRSDNLVVRETKYWTDHNFKDEESCCGGEWVSEFWVREKERRQPWLLKSKQRFSQGWATMHDTKRKDGVEKESQLTKHKTTLFSSFPHPGPYKSPKIPCLIIWILYSQIYERYSVIIINKKDEFDLFYTQTQKIIYVIDCFCMC